MKLKLSKEFEEYLQKMTKRQLRENHKRFFKNLKKCADGYGDNGRASGV